MPRRPAAAAPLLLVAVLSGCELQEVVVAEPETLVIAEVFLQTGAFGPRGIAYLHRSIGAPLTRVPDALVELVTGTGATFRFNSVGLTQCVLGTLPLEVEGSCYILDSAAGPLLVPGARFEVRITVPDVGTLQGTTTIPGDFDMTLPTRAEQSGCSLPPETRLELTWTPSNGAWAYVAETEIFGLPELLRPLGIEVEDDPVVLVGLSVSRSDTTIVFPTEFGLFDRADLDRDLLNLLQAGLPEGAGAAVVLAAGDRNYVNWVRGGGFNPSGRVRIPSLLGSAGTGVFGSQVVRRVFIVAEDPDLRTGPACSGTLPRP
jgi:hypothetical protein